MVREGRSTSLHLLLHVAIRGWVLLLLLLLYFMCVCVMVLQDTQYKIYEVARKRFGHGGTSRIQFTLVPLTFCVMRLTREMYDLKDDPATKPKTNIKKLFRFLHEVVSALGSHYSEMAFKLFLSCARLADSLGFEPIAYEYLSQSFTLYEDMATAKMQVRSVTLAAGVLYECTNFSEENCRNLVTSVAKYSAKLLKKPDQCRMVQHLSLIHI